MKRKDEIAYLLVLVDCLGFVSSVINDCNSERIDDYTQKFNDE